MTRISKVLHYTFGLAEDFGGKPWSLVHHVCLKSAIERIKPDQVFFHYEHEPTGPWWTLSRDLVTLMQVTAPREIFGNPLLHVAHRSDVLRLQKLNEYGGIYLDADVLVHRSFDDLLDHSAVLSMEGEDASVGISNAVILAETECTFYTTMAGLLPDFPQPGRDEFWNEHSIQLPAGLAKRHAEEVTILDHTAFNWPLSTPDHLDWIYKSSKTIPLDATYANHLWESRAFEFLSNLTPGDVRSRDSNFHLWARPFVADLPNDYGAPSFSERLSHAGQKTWGKTGRIIFSARAWPRSAARNLAKAVLSENVLRRRSFQKVYKAGLWGSDGSSKFFSGVGSRGPAVDFYVDHMGELLLKHREEFGRPFTIVDIGCGDFQVASKLLEKVPDCNYVGCDIVPELIAHHTATYATNRIKFQVLDAVHGSLPEGDVCLIRQVLQHLPNADILRIVHRLPYPVLYVTEGQPVERIGPFNPDKPVSADVRFNWRTGRGRGVELAEAPFSLDAIEVFRVFANPTELVVTERVHLTFPQVEKQ